ncbi:ribonuclease HII [Marinilactibacillus kalidii]|uniref:ribonuclease HII n=1 Tax=Marinilactibacillus kalidii TaxID=2820274 RepID=UPI001ABE18F4|nr:ribonuclease HII [Marinilactibacillus kalidii]
MKKQTIKEIKALLNNLTDVNDPQLVLLKEDERKGVQDALLKWQRAYDKKQALVAEYDRMSVFEQKALSTGASLVAGIDEVGRGPLAGPVVAAAVILDPANPIIGLNDSKKLPMATRERLYQEIKEKALAYSVGQVDAQGIDQINIYQASKRAMQLAVEGLALSPDHLLIDAMKLDLRVEQESLIKGDARSVSIAAASIIAKVTRDKMMEDYHQIYPGYGFDQNAGYGTKQHLEGLDALGITPIHRLSFAPVRARSDYR